MSPSELAQRAAAVLIAEIRDDLASLKTLATQAETLRARFPAGEEPSAFDLMALGGFLHHLFTAAESIHERIARVLDGMAPQGDRSHQDLLTRMGVALPGVRPAVLSVESRARLGLLLRFRHFFRHAYRTELLWAELKPLTEQLATTVSSYSRDLDAFIAHLESRPRE